jgi:hypothetical protein
MHMFSNLGVFFEKSTDIFSKIVCKNTMDNLFTKLVVLSFSKHNYSLLGHCATDEYRFRLHGLQSPIVDSHKIEY